MKYKVGHSQKRNRFEIENQGGEAYLEYVIAEGIMDITHTFVPPVMEGKGFGSALVKQALEYARENHLKVASSCVFAENYIFRHKGYEDLLVS